MMRRFGLPVTLSVVLLSAGTAHTQSGTGALTTPDPASAQPTLPKPMPEFTVPTSQGGSKPNAAGKVGAHAVHRHRYHVTRTGAGPIERPALATVDLSERLPYPPQPPHATVPVPAYPFENFVTAFTAPPPPIVCRPTRRDRFQPDPLLHGGTPVLCTADNP